MQVNRVKNKKINLVLSLNKLQDSVIAKSQTQDDDSFLTFFLCFIYK